MNDSTTFKDKTLMITGGTGSFGNTLLKHFMNTDLAEIRIFSRDEKKQDDMRHELQANHPQYAGKVKFYIGDVRNPQSIRDAMPGVNYIFHAAALKQVPSCEFFPMQAVQTNIIGTSVLMDACRKYGNVRFHQVSTDEVYGSLSKDYIDPQPLEITDADVRKVVTGRTDLHTYGKRFFTETTPLDPRSPYSASKTSADMFVRAYHETYGMPVNITRCSNNYGPYHFPEKLIPLIIKNILAGQKLPVYGKGDNVRDWLYVEDHARAIDLIFHNGKTADTYNIGGFNEWKNIDIIKVVIKTVDRLLGRPEDADLDLITYVTDRKGHDMRYAIDSRKLQKELGWEPSLQFEEGIEETVKWYLENQEWMDHVTSGEYQKYYEEMYC